MLSKMRVLHAAPEQRGIALIIGLIILAVLSLIGVAAFSVSTQEERMAGNSRDRIRAFEAAEAALRDCENLASTPGSFQFSNSGDGSYTAPLSPAQSFTDKIPDLDNPSPYSVHLVTSVTNTEWSKKPVCIAEQFQVQSGTIVLGNPVPTTTVVHITAQGYGTNPNTVVKLESHYAIPS